MARCRTGSSDVVREKLAVERRAPPVDSIPADDVLDFDERDLAKRERETLNDAIDGRVSGCTRDEIPGLERVVERVAEHAGLGEDDVYYGNDRTTTPVVFRGRRYQALILYDTAETGGGPLGV